MKKPFQALILTFKEILGMSPQLRKRAFLVEIVLRLHITLLAVVFSVLQADSLKTSIAILALAIAMDIARNLFAPELTMTPMQIQNKVLKLTHIRQDVKSSNHILNRNVQIFILPAFTYMILYALICPIPEIAPPLATVRWFMPIQDFTTHISNPIRRIGGDLLAHGYPNRALEVGHLFMVGTWVFILIVLIPFWSLARKISYEGIKNSDRSPNAKSIQEYDKFLTYGWPFFWGIYYLYSNLMHNDWKKINDLINWHFQNDNYAMFYYILGIAISWVSFFLITALMFYRLKLLSYWFGRNPTPNEIATLRLSSFHSSNNETLHG